MRVKEDVAFDPAFVGLFGNKNDFRYQGLINFSYPYISINRIQGDIPNNG
jgi:hypothetical protein